MTRPGKSNIGPRSLEARQALVRKLAVARPNASPGALRRWSH